MTTPNDTANAARELDELGSADTGAVADTLAKRDTNGRLKAADGVADDDLVSIGQVADTISQVDRAETERKFNEDASLIMDYANNKYEVYDRFEGKTSKLASQIQTFTRASSKTGFTPRGLDEAGVDVPFNTRDPETGEPLGLGVHEQRANLFVNNQAPATQDISVTAQDYTLSFYGTGEIVLSGAATGTLTGTGGSNERVTLTVTPTAGVITATVVDTEENVQFEAGEFATPPIITGATPETSAADNASIEGLDTADWFNPNEGTFVVDVSGASGNGAALTVSDDTVDELGSLIFSTSSSTIGGSVKGRGAAWNLGKLFESKGGKIGISWNSENFLISANGATREFSESLSYDDLQTMKHGLLQSDYLNGEIKKTTYSPTYNTAEKLSVVTTMNLTQEEDEQNLTVRYLGANASTEDEATINLWLPDTLRQRVEQESGGKQTVLYDNSGNASVHTIIPKFRYEDLGFDTELGTGVCTAFLHDGVEKDAIFVGSHLGSLVGGKLCSLPRKDPAASIDWDALKSACESKGAGWHMMTGHEWAAVALWCAANGFEPRGNTNYGRAHDRTLETAIRQDGGIAGDTSGTARTLTGSGPNGWAHNAAANGIFDLVGNVWEWQDCFKIIDGRVFAAPDNDWTLAESSWIDTGVDVVAANPWTSSSVTGTQLTDRLLVTYPGISLQGRLYVNSSGERMPRRGGSWGSGGDAGLAALSLDNTRSTTVSYFGGRPVFVEV